MARRPLIMIHGFRGTHHGLELISEHLTGFERIIPDLPGFADGDSLDRYGLDEYVEWLDGFVASHKFSQKPVLLGHSFGSIVCAAYAAKYPGKISDLILVNPIGAPALEGPRAVLSKLAVFYYWVGKKLPNAFARRWLASNLVVMIMSVTMAKTKDRQLRDFIHDQHRKYFSLFHTPASVAQGFETSISYSVRDFAAKVKVRTLLIAGGKDDITPLEKQESLQKLFPDATLEVIHHVGHLTHYETPKQVARLIQAFIKVS